MNKIFASLITLTLIFPSLIFAQEEVSPAPTEASPVETPSEPEPIVVEEATPVQETIPSELLEETANPQESTNLEEAIELIDEATEERLEEEVIIEASGTTTESSLEVLIDEGEDVVEVIEQATTTQEVAEIALVDLEPKKEYTFEINGASIATEETPEWSTDLEQTGKKVTEAPAVSIEGASHQLNVSGECSDPYYVILIYKDSEGYNTNPSSYIYNRAYPCENGRYSYALSELPFSLESGTFYLLVAGQGNKGPWKPISAMIPIGITVKTILPEETSTNESTP